MGKVKSLLGAYPESLMLLSEIHAALGNLLDSHHQLACEVRRLEEYERKYAELLDSDIAHGRATMNNLLEVLITPGVMPALRKSSTFEEPE